MHHPLPFPATKMKCGSALAKEDGERRVATGENGQRLLMPLLHCMLKPRPRLASCCCLPSLAVNTHNTGAYGRGGRKVSNLKNHPGTKTAGRCLFALTKTHQRTGLS